MIDRRRLLHISAMTGVAAFLPDRTHAESAAQDQFDQALKSTLATKADDIARASFEREREAFEVAYYAARPLLGRPAPSEQPISERAKKLIIGFEVISEDYYKMHLQSPIWPGGSSGVTIGFGYDIGYSRKDWLAEDWKSILDDQTIEALAKDCGVKGVPAKSLAVQLGAVRIPWSLADQQFRERELKMYVAETIDHLPNAEKLSADSLGALVSLVYNRGPSFKALGPRYEDMRAIRLHMVAQSYSEIPADIRRMKKLWVGKGLDGLILRRELEAQLFEAGLA